MTDFLIKSTVSLIVFLGFYHLILEREKMHQFNRFFLLFAIVISVAIPFVSFEIIKEIPVNFSNQTNLIPQKINTFPEPEKTDYKLLFLWTLYGIVTVIMAIRFGRNIHTIFSKISISSKVDFKNSKLVLIEQKILPHTFLHYIFVNAEDHKNQNIESELYTHEFVHVSQKHTLDVLFIELLRTIFWFNPLFIFYKKAIQLNHEFLADQEIVKIHNNVPFYQNLLLEMSNGKTVYLASNLNYLVTKKRLTMMKKRTSKNMAFLKKIAVVPIIAVLVALSCIKTVAQESKKNEKAATNKKASNDEKIYSNTTVIIKDKDKNVIVKEKYSKLTEEQKRKVSPRIIPSKKTPTSVEYEAFKNSEKYAVWIDNVNVSNSKLNDYQASNFVWYFNSVVRANARSKKYPQKYQVHLLTEEGYAKTFNNAQKLAPETIIITENDEPKKELERRKSYGYQKMEFDTTMFKRPRNP